MGEGPEAEAVKAEARAAGIEQAVHLPGFVQAKDQGKWHAHAGALVHPSIVEPWGLVVNEAAACGLPLLVSNRAGCVETLVPDGNPSTGLRFDPFDMEAMANALEWMAALPESERKAMGSRASETVAQWGPDRFAQGLLEALELALGVERERRKIERTFAAASY